jgi:hypothetical protein
LRLLIEKKNDAWHATKGLRDLATFCKTADAGRTDYLVHSFSTISDGNEAYILLQHRQTSSRMTSRD